MSWLAELATASTLGSLVLALIYAHLYARERRPYHLIGAAAWGVYLCVGYYGGLRPSVRGAPLPMPPIRAAGGGSVTGRALSCGRWLPGAMSGSPCGRAAPSPSAWPPCVAVRWLPQPGNLPFYWPAP
jgi:hypothetical protein